MRAQNSSMDENCSLRYFAFENYSFLPKFVSETCVGGVWNVKGKVIFFFCRFLEIVASQHDAQTRGSNHVTSRVSWFEHRSPKLTMRGAHILTCSILNTVYYDLGKI